MGFVDVNPEYREALRRNAMCAAVDFLRLGGVILCGHRDRHVLKVSLPGLEPGQNDRVAFLKKEHRVPWRDRLANALAGFGFVSKSTREARVLQKLAEANIPCAVVLAYGEQGRQAFVLLDAQSEMTELRRYLAEHPTERRTVARVLGRRLAKMHAAGFTHGDLYSKHIFVGPGPRFSILDWQRARLKNRTSWRARRTDLATLDATLAAATDRLRLVFLRHYLRESGIEAGAGWAAAIREQSEHLQKRRRIRALRALPSPSEQQSLVWLDGEALCVTPAFLETLEERIPECLDLSRAVDPRVSGCSTRGLEKVLLENGRAGLLVRYRTLHAWHWLASWWRREPSLDVQAAALLFRLERHGIPTPKLLAFGHKCFRPWTYSFVLMETTASAASLLDHLLKTTAPKERGNWLRQAGSLLRRLHEAGYCMGNRPEDFDAIGVNTSATAARVLLSRIDGLKRRRQAWPALARKDFAPLIRSHRLRRTDMMRFYLAYVGSDRAAAPARSLLREIMAKQVSA